jgi:hypothetical protein
MSTIIIIINWRKMESSSAITFSGSLKKVMEGVPWIKCLYWQTNKRVLNHLTTTHWCWCETVIHSRKKKAIRLHAINLHAPAFCFHKFVCSHICHPMWCFCTRRFFNPTIPSNVTFFYLCLVVLVVLENTAIVEVKNFVFHTLPQIQILLIPTSEFGGAKVVDYLSINGCTDFWRIKTLSRLYHTECSKPEHCTWTLIL